MGSIVTSLYKTDKDADCGKATQKKKEGDKTSQKICSSKTCIPYKTPYYKKRKNKKKDF